MQEGTYRGTRRVVWGAARDLIDGVHRIKLTGGQALDCWSDWGLHDAAVIIKIWILLSWN